MKLFKSSLVAGAIAVLALTSSVSMAQTTYDSGVVSLALADNDAAGQTNVQNIFGLGTITDIDVGLDIDHTWQGDLIVTLEHGGVTVPLLFRAGDSDGASFGFSADNFGSDAAGFFLDDEGAAVYDSANAGNGWGAVDDPGIADVEGNWIPFGMFDQGGMGGLNAFDGMDDSGDWTLFLSDNAAGDTGTLNSWSLVITTAAVPEPSSMAILLMGMSGLAFVRRRK